MRAAPGGLAAAITVALAVLLVMLNGGSALAKFAPASGTSLAPWDAELQRIAALRALNAGQRDRARQFALTSLRAMPFNQASMTIAALDITGPRSAAALNQSAALGWRDPISNMRLIRAALIEQDPQVAAQRIDALARITMDRRVEALADTVLAMPGGQAALADRAAHHLGPGWIPDFLAIAPATPRQLANRRAFLLRLDSDDGAWRRTAVGRAMAGFDAAGHRDAAYQLWRELLADRALWQGGVYDGKFLRLGETAPLGGEWVQLMSQPVAVDRLAGGGASLRYIGAEPGLVLSQAITLAGPDIVLTAQWHGDEAMVRSFSWQLACIGSGPIALTRTMALQAGVWHDRYTGQRPDNCPLAALSLSMVKRPAAEAAVELQSVSLAAQP
jgi:hypothetical protein